MSSALRYKARMSKVLKDSTVSLRVPGDLRADLEDLADADQRSMSSLMVKVLREYVARELEQGKGKQSRRG
jgi:predicted transcriptional regulator